jgi:hypothetical protein
VVTEIVVRVLVVGVLVRRAVVVPMKATHGSSYLRQFERRDQEFLAGHDLDVVPIAARAHQ